MNRLRTTPLAMIIATVALLVVSSAAHGQFTGACCFPGDTCGNFGQAVCVGSGGVWLGFGTNCDTADCNTCQGSCGGVAPGGGCSCDAGCFSRGDCCDDVCHHCSQSFPTECAGNFCGIALPVGDGNTGFLSMNHMTASGVTDSCGLVPDDRWLAYTASCSGTATASLCLTGDIIFISDVGLSVFDACPDDGGTELACASDNQCVEGAIVSWPAIAGNVYLIRLSATGIGMNMTFQCDPAPNVDGVVMTALGNATIATNDLGHIVVSNLGADGTDGVRADFFASGMNLVGTTTLKMNFPPGMTKLGVVEMNTLIRTDQVVNTLGVGYTLKGPQFWEMTLVEQIFPEYSVTVFDGGEAVLAFAGLTDPVIGTLSGAGATAITEVHTFMEFGDPCTMHHFDAPLDVVINGQSAVITDPDIRFCVTNPDILLSAPVILGPSADIDILIAAPGEEAVIESIEVGPPPGCAGNCGGVAAIGCACDAACFDRGDCCSDVCEFCAPAVHVPSQFATIQGAIDSINGIAGVGGCGVEIVVAPGTYNEAINFNGKAVHLRSSGGPEVTIIDATGLNTTVVRCINGEGPDTILEGFTITGGVGNFGGGMNNGTGTSPTVMNCVFVGNSANRGGGMRNAGSSPTVTNCIFKDNSASQYGGAMHNSGSSSPTVSNCTFTGNSAEIDGGGIHSIGNSSPTVSNCTFIGNSAENEGGGMYSAGSGTNPTVTGCLFEANSAGNAGGGMRNVNGSTAMVSDSLFQSNLADVGGGMSNSDSSPTVTNCTFRMNTADVHGGGMNNHNNSPTITNCNFESNVASTAGAIRNSTSGHPAIGDTVFCGNEPDHVDGTWDDLGGNEFSEECPSCPADLDENGVVNVFDLLQLLGCWGDVTPESECEAADLTNSGSVDVFDLLELLGHWGECP